jgi:hypothetical protein
MYDKICKKLGYHTIEIISDQNPSHLSSLTLKKGRSPLFGRASLACLDLDPDPRSVCADLTLNPDKTGPETVISAHKFANN